MSYLSDLANVELLLLLLEELRRCRLSRFGVAHSYQYRELTFSLRRVWDFVKLFSKQECCKFSLANECA